MYLQKLEIFGFKSFANKSVFKFSPGITAVVGPNGCGKTNVVDAIRWVLGEQKTSVLRSDVMENVIFNGAGNKKPLGLAEVTLTLENTKYILPTEYSEVTISRRLYRDGDSNYLLNNTQCRLKDIIDLFMDTGMGADSYSVIELKMVEAILSGKPEERRHLFEEAAGVTKYKVKRKEASRKLSYVQSDLVRVQDRVQELDKIVNSLARQAAKTKRYNKLHIELTELELALIKSDYLNYDYEIKKLEESLALITSDKEKTENEITSDEVYFTGLESKQHEIEIEFQIALDSENQVYSELAEKRKESAVSTERINSLMNKRDNLSIELNDTKNYISRLSRNLTESKDDIEIYKEKSVTISVKSKELIDEKILFDSRLRDIRNNVNKSNEKVIKLKNEINSLISTSQKNLQRKKSIEQRINESNREILKLNEDIKKLDIEMVISFEEKEAQKERLTNSEDFLKSEKTRKENLLKDIDEQKHNISEIKLQLATQNASLEFLSTLVDADDTSKYLLGNNEWNPKSGKVLLIEAIGSEDDHRVAIESALGNYARYFVVDDIKEANTAIDCLYKNNKGKAGFICKKLIPEIPEPKEIAFDNGVLGYISEIVHVSEQLRNLMRIILGNAVLTKDLDSAKKVIEDKISDFTVTLSGESYSSKGYLRGGSVSKKEGISVGKIERVSKLKKQVDKLNDELHDAQLHLNNLNLEYVKIDTDNLAKQVKIFENSINTLEHKFSQLSYKKDSIGNNISNLTRNIEINSVELKELSSDTTDSDTKLESLKNELVISEAEYKDSKDKLTEAEKKYYEKSETAKNSELEVVKSENELKNALQNKDRIEGQLKGANNKSVQLSNDLDYAVKTIVETENKIGMLIKLIQEIEINYNEAKGKRERIAENKTLLEQEISAFINTLSNKRKNYERLVNQFHQIDLKLNEAKTKFSVINEKISESEDYMKKFSVVEITDNFSPTATKLAITELKEKLSALGSVNFMALEQFESESTAFEFLKKQVHDLVESEKTLQDTIKEINETAKEKFIKTFEEIRTNFKRLFKKLFSDEADSELKLADGDPLECDIEIIAKPPSKRPHSIEMLSSGEKTLTSIALLFGIYLVKPSPFCILDEVDAPLDDTNIDKFLAMIRDFSKETQFLVVTHNKRTMEASDTMYGITQQDEGISKIVSVRFENETVKS